MPGGVFQTDRVIFDNSIWKNPAKFRLFFYIYGNAIFSKEGVDIGGIHLSRGQLLKSYRKLSDELEYIENHSLKKYSISHIKKLIGELVEEKRLKMEVSPLGTVFTVLNYEQYQGFERFEKDNRERSENTARTLRERSENNNKNDKKDKKDKDTLLSGKGFPDDSIELVIASELFNLILLNNPSYKKPNLQTWAGQIDLMIRRDKRTESEISEVIKWCQQDSFWQGNILSTKKLREKYDQLTMKMKSPKQAVKSTPNFGAERKPKKGKFDSFYL